jgi:hypothetical protein
MKKETFKELIELESTKHGNVSDFKDAVLKLFDLYELDKSAPTVTYDPRLDPYSPFGKIGVEYVPDEVPYGEICGCNPKNGGSGICGCVIGNKMVPNPKKTWTTQYTITGNNSYATGLNED